MHYEILYLGLVVPLLISGCADNGKNQAELSPIPEVRESFVEESNKLKSQTFDNLNFENTYFSFPDVNEVYSFEYKIADFDISADDAYDYLCRRTDELFPGMFSNEEKQGKLSFMMLGQQNTPHSNNTRHWKKKLSVYSFKSPHYRN